MSHPQPSHDPLLIARQRAAARRTAWILAGVALAIMLAGFIKAAVQ